MQTCSCVTAFRKLQVNYKLTAVLYVLYTVQRIFRVAFWKHKINEQLIGYILTLHGSDEKTSWLKTRCTCAEVHGVQRKKYIIRYDTKHATQCQSTVNKEGNRITQANYYLTSNNRIVNLYILS